MAKTRRNFLRKVTAFSFLASIPGIGLSKNLLESQAGFSSVLQIGGLNASRFGLPHSLDGLVLSRDFSSEKNRGDLRSFDSSSELIRLGDHSNPSYSQQELNAFSSAVNQATIEPYSVSQGALKKSNFLIRQIGGLKIGILGVVIPNDTVDFDKRVDKINGIVAHLKKAYSCQQVFCLAKPPPSSKELALVERFAQQTSEVSQVFCSLSQEDKKPSVLQSMRNADGRSVLLNLNQYKSSDLSEIGFSGALIEYSNH